jgi:hypothetical protein
MNFNPSNIRVLHVEPTTVCNAACPQCARENPELYQEHNRSELTVEQCQQLFTVEFVQQLEKMFMCGNFGDPAAGANTLEIFRWFRSINPTITLGMNSNGSLRTTEWWQDLAAIMNQPNDYVVFSIDGLEDTNHIYRRNTVWSKLIENAQAFIDAGGHAHWDMLIFDHNQHQLHTAQQLAASMGFQWFRSKVSKRFKTQPVSWLTPPKNYQLPNVNHIDHIDCHALKERSLFVSATGEIFPCCWIGNHTFSRDPGLDTLLNTPNFQGVIDSWISTPHIVCSQTCGASNGTTSFDAQWQTQVQLQ